MVLGQLLNQLHNLPQNQLTHLLLHRLDQLHQWLLQRLAMGLDLRLEDPKRALRRL